MAETTCPVFRPTEKEFKSFRRYMEDVVDPIAGKVGLCKIIPPPGLLSRTVLIYSSEFVIALF